MCNYPRAIRPIVLIENALAFVRRQRTRDLRKQRTMMFGTIQIDEQARHRVLRSAAHRTRGAGARAASAPGSNRDATPATPVRRKQLSIAGRYSIAAVFARDEEATSDAGMEHRPSARQSQRCRYVESNAAAVTFGPTDRLRRVDNVPSPRITSSAARCGASFRWSIAASARHASPAVCAPSIPSTRR